MDGWAVVGAGHYVPTETLRPYRSSARPPAPPTDTRHRDYERINDIFEAEMDGLRETFHSPLSAGPDGAVWDRFADWACDLVVRFTRELAWDRATEVRSRSDVDTTAAEMLARLDLVASSLGRLLLAAPGLPV